MFSTILGILTVSMNFASGVAANDSFNVLLAGNSRFVNGSSEHPHQSLDRRKAVVKKQTPHAVIVTCSDSRVVPELIFDQGIGDLFVVRVAGNTISKRELGSIEYAIEHLGCKLVMVMGHTNCGAVKAAFEENHAMPGSIGSIVSPIIPAVHGSSRQMGDRLTNAVVQNVRMVVARLTKADKLMTECYHHGDVKVIGSIYNLETGIVSLVSGTNLLGAKKVAMR